MFHGRAVPPARRSLAAEFADTICSDLDWDVALLQELPPWWCEPLARRAGAHGLLAYTSRNWLSAARRAIASRAPDLLKSNGGGSNAILARAGFVDHRTLRLRILPERRVAQLARLRDGACVVNWHGSARVELARAELKELWKVAERFAGGAPILLGGDLNLRDPPAPAGFRHIARRDVDHVFARDLRAVGRVVRPAVALSDHPPLLVTVTN